MSAFNDLSIFTTRQLKARIAWIEKLIARDGAEKHAFYAREVVSLKDELAKRG